MYSLVPGIRSIIRNGPAGALVFGICPAGPRSERKGGEGYREAATSGSRVFHCSWPGMTGPDGEEGRSDLPVLNPNTNRTITSSPKANTVSPGTLIQRRFCIKGVVSSPKANTVSPGTLIQRRFCIKGVVINSVLRA